MLEAVKQALTSRAVALAASALSLALAVMLATSWSAWNAERATLEARIADLSQRAERSQSLWKAQLAACHAAAASGQRLTEASYEAPRDVQEAARRLLAEGPEGIDVCARMESADQAVLSTLK